MPPSQDDGRCNEPPEVNPGPAFLGEGMPHSGVLSDVISPMPTEPDVSDAELIEDSPEPKGNCWCHLIEFPDRQPEFLDDWDMCDYCKARRHPVDDMTTVVDHDELNEVATTIIDQVWETDHLGGIPPSPIRVFRRLRPMIEEPDVVDPSYYMGATASVDETGNEFHLSPDTHVEVSWFTWVMYMVVPL